MKRYFYFIAFILSVSGCDTFYKISDEVIYSERFSDLNCIKTAITLAKEVDLDKETSIPSSCVALCESVPTSNYSISYRVLNTKEKVYGNVQILKYKNKPTEIKNYAGRLNKDFLKEDKPLIEKAVSSVSKSLKVNCGLNTSK